MTKKNKAKNKISLDKESLYSEIDNRIRGIIKGIVSPIEQRMIIMNNHLETIKANVITANTILNLKGIISKEEFEEEFRRYSSEVGTVNGSGRMEGSPILSLYNLGE